MLVASQGPPARLWETEFCGQRLAAASSRERRTDPPNCRRRPRSTLLTLIRSRDFGALGTTAADQDFLVELRGIEPLTSAVRLQFPELGILCCELQRIDNGLNYNGQRLLALDFDCSHLSTRGSYVVASSTSYQTAPTHDHDQVGSCNSAE
jgi:hypothetical protein